MCLHIKFGLLIISIIRTNYRLISIIYKINI